MARRKLLKSRDQKVEVQLSSVEKEYLARISYQGNLSMGAYLREKLPPESIMQHEIETLRKIQKGMRGVILDGRKKD